MKAKTLQEFADGINGYLKNHPEHGNLPVITAIDDEGNGFNQVFYDPSYAKDWEVYADEIEGVCVS